MNYPVDLFYESFGSGEPLIVLHGLLGSSSNWSSTCQIIGEYLHVYVPDLRNHGRSPQSPDLNYDIMVQDIKHLMDRLQFDSAHILGHSMGGKIAMLFADQYPEMVRTLAVIDIAPKGYPPWHEPIITALLELQLNEYDTYRSIVEDLASSIPSLAVRYFLMKNIRSLKNGGFEWRVNLEAIHRNADKLNGRIRLKNEFQQKVLFITGEQSNFVQKEDEAQILRSYPEAEVMKIYGAGHWVHIDAKEQFVKTVLKFIFN